MLGYLHNLRALALRTLGYRVSGLGLKGDREKSEKGREV